VQAFTVYEDSISESRAQLQAITLVIGTLQGAKVFGVDNYDTLITKAALHGAKLLKKPHQSTAVHLASHLWWQEAPVVEESEEGGGNTKDAEKEEGEGVKAVCIDISYIPFLLTDAHLCESIHIKTANVYWSACRNPYGSLTPPQRK